MNERVQALLPNIEDIQSSRVAAIALSGALVIASCSSENFQANAQEDNSSAKIELDEPEDRLTYRGESCEDNPLTFNVYGEDGSPVIAQVGFDFHGTNSVSVMPNGQPKEGRPYGHVVHVNTPGELDAPVTQACVSHELDESIDSVSIEVYSSTRFDDRLREIGREDLITSDRYLDSMYHNVEITGEMGQIPDLVLPARCDVVDSELASSGHINAIVYGPEGQEYQPYRHIAWSRHAEGIRGFAAKNTLLPNASDQAQTVEVEDGNRYMSKVHTIVDDNEYIVEVEDVYIDSCAETDLVIDLSEDGQCLATVKRNGTGEITQPECDQRIEDASEVMTR